MRNKLIAFGCLVVSIIFLILSAWGYVTDSFYGSDEDFRLGFTLGFFIFGSSAFALLFNLRWLLIVALLCPLWGSYLAFLIHQVIGSTILDITSQFVIYNFGILLFSGFPRSLDNLWPPFLGPWAMLLYLSILFTWSFPPILVLILPLGLLYIYSLILIVKRLLGERGST